jgi:hypothetical protein
MILAENLPAMELGITLGHSRRDGSRPWTIWALDRTGYKTSLLRGEWASGRPDNDQYRLLVASMVEELERGLLLQFGIQGLLGESPLPPR